MNLYGIEFTISLISLVFAYLISVTLANVFRAWVALKMGDDTAESLGLLSFNPLVHIDFLGGLFLLFFGFGWGRNVPVNPFRIHGPFRGLKIACAYLSDSFAYFVIALVSFFSLVWAFGVRVVGLAIPMIGSGILLQSDFAQAYPESSSLAISLGLIGIALIFLSLLLAVLSFIISGFNLFILTIFGYSMPYEKKLDIILLVLTMLLIYLFIGYLRYAVILLMLNLAAFVGIL